MTAHLRSVTELDAAGITALLDLTDHMVEISGRAIPKVPALRGRTVVSLFYEDSTRTRLSFETAAKRLSADTMTFSAGTSSATKGESLELLADHRPLSHGLRHWLALVRPPLEHLGQERAIVVLRIL